MLLRIICHCCANVFELCRACYRGHRYCCAECRAAGYREDRREAQRLYRQTDNGKANHRLHEKLRRMRGTLERRTIEIIRSCGCLVMRAAKGNIFSQNGNCRLCGVAGRIVDMFPRRT